MNYSLYTDGSDFKATTHRLGVAGILVSPDESGKTVGNVMNTYQSEIIRPYMKMRYDTEDCSNPTMELLAVLECLKHMPEVLRFSKGDTLTVYADYRGVSEWMNGKWKINKPYIKAIHDQIESWVRDNLKCRIRYAWVKGHQSVSKMGTEGYWNSRVDEMAKGK